VAQGLATQQPGTPGIQPLQHANLNSQLARDALEARELAGQGHMVQRLQKPQQSGQPSWQDMGHARP